MISRENGALRIQGAVTMKNVSAELESGVRLFDGKEIVIDLTQVEEVDSSALGMVFEWMREARRRNMQLRFSGLSANLASLAKLYGVTELIPFAE